MECFNKEKCFSVQKGFVYCSVIFFYFESTEQNKNQQIREQIEQQKKTLEHARNMLSEKQKQLQEYRTSFEKKKQEVANLHNELIATRR